MHPPWAAMTRADIMDWVPLNESTFGGNLRAIAAQQLATLDVTERRALAGEIRQRGQSHDKRVADWPGRS